MPKFCVGYRSSQPDHLPSASTRNVQDDHFLKHEPVSDKLPRSFIFGRGPGVSGDVASYQCILLNVIPS
jgi:hypothetical protein